MYSFVQAKEHRHGLIGYGIAVVLCLALPPFSLKLHADQTVFSGTLKANGIKTGGSCTTPGPFTFSAAVTASVQPALDSLASSGGPASGVFIIYNLVRTGCTGSDAPPGGPVSVTVAPGGTTTMTLTVPDPNVPGGVHCMITLRGTPSSVSGDAISCFENLTSGSATMTLTAQPAGPPRATLRVAPAGLQFTGVAGGGATPSQTLYVINDTSFQLDITGQWSGTAIDSDGSRESLQAVFVQTGSTFVGAVTFQGPEGTGTVR